ncbi:MAG: hypothetical protein LBT51_00445, partial [Fusobacteriaceae bacterium]|nr:hypothetical protein [Fusobacteriaceae bacterium]
ITIASYIPDLIPIGVTFGYTTNPTDWDTVVHNPAAGINNILILADNGSRVINRSLQVGVSGVTSPAGTIGVYLNGDENTYEDIPDSQTFPTAYNTKITPSIRVNGGANITGSSLKVFGGAIGVYANSDNATTSGNELLLYASVNGNKSVGAYLSNSSTIDGDISVTATTGSAIGIYGTGGEVVVNDYNGSGDLSLTLGTASTTNSGTGMYLTDGAYATGADIKVINNSTSANAGIYYDGATGGLRTHGTKIILDGSNVVGIFANNESDITTSKTITEIGTGTNRYAVIVGESKTTTSAGSTAKFTNNGTITLSTTDSIGIYTENGIIVNGINGIINTTGTSVTGTEGGIVIGINKNAIAGNIVDVTNNGIINAEDSLGIVIDSSSANTTGTVTNTGEINLITTDKTIGVAIFGDGSIARVVYDGTGSTINNSEGTVGIYLNNTASGQVLNAGNIKFSNPDSVGVFAAASSIVDFDISYEGTGTGLYLTGGSSFTKAITRTDVAASTPGGVAVYVDDSSSLITGATINAGNYVVGTYLNNNYTLTNVTINAIGEGSTGVYIAAEKTVTLAAGANIIVGNGTTKALGIYVDGTGSTDTILDTNDGELTINKDSVGVFTNGSKAIANLGTAGALIVNFNDPSAILAYNDGGTLNIGNLLTVASGTGTIGFVYNGNLSTSHNNITAGAGATAFLGTYDASGAGSYSITNTGNITVTAGGTGIAISDDGAYAGGTLTLENVGTITASGVKAVGLYSNSGIIDNSTGTITVTNNGIGIYAELDTNSVVTAIDVGTLNVNKAIGVVVKNDGQATPSFTGTITLNAGSTGTPDVYTIGSYFISTGTTTITDLPVYNYLGGYIIGTVIEGGTNTVNPAITTPGTGVNQIGALVKGGTTTFSNTITTNGDENIGLYAEGSSSITYSSITVNNSTQVLDSNGIPTFAKSSIGAYIKNSTISAGSPYSTSQLVVGDNSIGIFGENTTFILGEILVGKKSIGVYSTPDPSIPKASLTPTNLDAMEDMQIDEGSYGIFAQDTNVFFGTGGIRNIDVGNDTAIGILSQGKGNVTVNADLTVDDKGTGKASIGIYKANGEGIITTNSGANWDIGEGGYGVYIENKDYKGTGQIRLNNSANIDLSMSAVGIYVNGNGKPNSAVVENSGTINVGSTYLGVSPPNNHKNLNDHLNSVGIYAGNSANVTNETTGIINVEFDHSVGVYVYGVGLSVPTTFINKGLIEVNNGAVGILAKGRTNITNDGTIILGDTPGPCFDGVDGQNIGIAAYGTSSTDIAVVTNNGTIEVGEGTGIYLNGYAKFENHGTITMDSGTGIQGPEGTFFNYGTFAVSDLNNNGVMGGTQTKTVDLGMPHGAVNITDDGTVVINNQFIHAGTLIAGNVIVDGAKIQITNDLDRPMFIVDSLSGTIELLPDFITTGNGYGWEVPNFVSNVNGGLALTGSAVNRVQINASPLFIAHMTTTGGLTVAKQPYAYLVTGTQFDRLYDGIDSLLALDQAGIGNDSQLLKSLNAYLDNIYRTEGTEAFDIEADRTLSEMRGDIYATIQNRMQNVQHVFDNSFEELLDSYNFTRDTGKFSVLYQQGSFRDDTIGIDDYDFRIQGLYYMKENEGMNYGNKWGYSFGFAVTRFDFDDAPNYFDKSKEDMYSVRVGAHRVTSFGEDDRLRLISRVELGYNRHESERTLELDKVYKNNGHYDSYMVTFDNKLEKTVFRNLSTDIKLYGAVNLEYGYIKKFSETAKGDSGLELDVKGEDYYSIVGEVGVKASKKVHIGKKMTAKIEGDVSYAYEFGNNHNSNKGRVNGGTEDYYDLIKPEKERGATKGRVGVTIEKRDHFGVTLDVEAMKHQNKSGTDVRYGVKFTYKL